MPDRFIAHSRVMRALVEQVRRFAAIDSNVLITGETGAGKNAVARELHARAGARSSVRHDRLRQPRRIPHRLELFGHERAFTDAVVARPGRFEVAGAGTVYLDAVTELAMRRRASCCASWRRRSSVSAATERWRSPRGLWRRRARASRTPCSAARSAATSSPPARAAARGPGAARASGGHPAARELFPGRGGGRGREPPSWRAMRRRRCATTRGSATCAARECGQRARSTRRPAAGGRGSATCRPRSRKRRRSNLTVSWRGAPRPTKWAALHRGDAAPCARQPDRERGCSASAGRRCGRSGNDTGSSNEVSGVTQNGECRMPWAPVIRYSAFYITRIHPALHRATDAVLAVVLAPSCAACGGCPTADARAGLRAAGARFFAHAADVRRLRRSASRLASGQPPAVAMSALPPHASSGRSRTRDRGVRRRAEGHRPRAQI